MSTCVRLSVEARGCNLTPPPCPLGDGLGNHVLVITKVNISSVISTSNQPHVEVEDSGGLISSDTIRVIE
jgi:hypothetical protein